MTLSAWSLSLLLALLGVIDAVLRYFHNIEGVDGTAILHDPGKFYFHFVILPAVIPTLWALTAKLLNAGIVSRRAIGGACV